MTNQAIIKTAAQINAHGVFLLLAEIDDKPCWYYFHATPSQLPIFRGLLHFLPLNLTLADYGNVLLADFGGQPPVTATAQISNADFSQSYEPEKSEVFCLNAVAADGRDFHTYLDVPSFLISKFHKKTASGEPMEYSEWGEVLHSGWGAPTPKTVAQMEHWRREKYQF